MQNEKDFYGHYNEFEYNHDFVIRFGKIDDDTLVFVVLDKNLYLYEKDQNKLLMFGVNNFTVYKIVTIFDNTFVFSSNIITL